MEAQQAYMIVIMSSLLHEFPYTSRFLERGQSLFRTDDRVVSMYVIESGEVHLVRRQKNGVAVVLQRGRAGTILAEASLFVERYHCDAIAVADSYINVISRKAVRQRFDTDPTFARAWANHLSSEVRQARLQVEILACRTVAERLDLWLSQNGELPDKGGWKDVAGMIGTSPEALYREIARRQRRPRR